MVAYAIRETVIVPFSRSILVVSDFSPRVAFMSDAFVRIDVRLLMGKDTHCPVSKAFIAPKSLIFLAVSFMLSNLFTNLVLQR